MAVFPAIVGKLLSALILFVATLSGDTIKQRVIIIPNYPFVQHIRLWKSPPNRCEDTFFPAVLLLQSNTVEQMLGVTTSDARMVMGQLLDLGLSVGVSLLRQMAPVGCCLIGSEEVSGQMLKGHRLNPVAEARGSSRHSWSLWAWGGLTPLYLN